MLQHSDLSNRQKALFGARGLKQPGSPEWCWQTIDLLKTQYEQVGDYWQDVLAVVAELEHHRAWEKVPPEKPYGSVDVLLKNEIGVGRRELDQRIASVRDRDAVDHQRERSVGRPVIGNNVPNSGRPEGNSVEKALRRLRKDRPDLHTRVLAGELSAHGAAIEAGFRSRTLSIPIDSPERIARTLTRHLTDDQLLELIQLLEQP